MSKKLNIYACSGIGDAPDGLARVNRYDYWTDNTNTLSNTQAVNGLLASINLAMAEVDYIPTLSDSEIIKRLNEIDLWVVCLDAAQNYAEKYESLEKAGRVIAVMLENNAFAYTSVDNDERDAHLDNLIAMFRTEMRSNGQKFPSSNDFLVWWDGNILTKNTVGLTASEQSKMQSALDTVKVSGIGAADWHDDAELSKYLTDAGTYFLYTYFTDAQLKKLPAKDKAIVKAKINKQKYTYNFCKSKFVGIYGSEAKYKDIIRTGIIAKFSAQPETVCEDISTGKHKIEGVGMAVSVILAIISAVVTILAALITGICEAVARSNEAKYASLDDKIVSGGVPDEGDFSGLEAAKAKTAKTAGGVTDMLPLLAVGGALLFSMMKKGKKKK